LQMLDPGALRTNLIPPLVYIEDVRADRKDYAIAGLVRRPPRSRDIQIGYTALSLSSPQKVRFRYRLEGRDEQWQDAGVRRQVFYSDLPPGQYRFHVTASNNDGLWNDSGAVLELAILPSYYQTRWFRGVLPLLLGSSDVLFEQPAALDLAAPRLRPLDGEFTEIEAASDHEVYFPENLRFNAALAVVAHAG